MTYEPTWFAEQISSLLLPWLLSSVLFCGTALSAGAGAGSPWNGFDFVGRRCAGFHLFARRHMHPALAGIYRVFIFPRSWATSTPPGPAWAEILAPTGLEAVVVMAALGAFVFVAGMKKRIFFPHLELLGQVKDAT